MSLDVSPELEAMVLKRVREEFYHSADDLLATALHVLTWAEGRADGKREILKYKLQAGIDDEEAGKMADADEVFRSLKNRSAENGPEHNPADGAGDR